MLPTFARRLSIGIVSGALLFAGAAIAAPRLDRWSTIFNERHGFAIAYPTDVFQLQTEQKTDEGRVLVSKDGKAKLLVAAFANSENQSLDEYRTFLLSGEYQGAKIDYAPVKKKWFVLSGERRGEMFYQRVSFTCSGKLINSWAMLYPADLRRTYDRVVEAVAKSYTPGAGRTGDCD